MKIRGFKKVLDASDWIRHDGPGVEAGVDLAIRGRFTRIQMSYEFGDVQLIRQIVFESAWAVHEASFPGVMPFEMDWKFKAGDLPLGSLIEFEGSDGAAEWDKYFREYPGGAQRKISPMRHFWIAFLEENRQFHVFARDEPRIEDGPVVW